MTSEEGEKKVSVLFVMICVRAAVMYVHPNSHTRINHATSTAHTQTGARKHNGEWSQCKLTLPEDLDRTVRCACRFSCPLHHDDHTLTNPQKVGIEGESGRGRGFASGASGV